MGGLSAVHMVGARETGEEPSQGDPSMFNTCDPVNVREIGRGRLRGVLFRRRRLRRYSARDAIHHLTADSGLLACQSAHPDWVVAPEHRESRCVAVE